MGDIGLTPLFFLIGSFYMFAGVVAGRAVLMDAVLDVAISGIAATRRDPLDVERSGWMLLGACVVAGGGVLLASGSSLALPAFLVSSILQVLHFAFLSPQRYDVEYPVSSQGRQQSLNAFALYVIVTCFVVWATFSGQLTSPAGWNQYLLGTLGAVWLAVCLWSFFWLMTLGDRPSEKSYEHEQSADDAAREAAEDAAEKAWATSVHIVLAPSCANYGLTDLQTGAVLEYLQIEALNLPADVMADLLKYSRDCVAVIDPDDPLMMTIVDHGKASELGHSGKRLFLELQAQFGDRVTYVPEFRPNIPKYHLSRLDVVSYPWTSSIFEGWPISDDWQDEFSHLLGLSVNVMLDLEAWNEETTQLYVFRTKEVFPDVTPQQIADSISKGRALATRIAKEFAATDRGNIPITYHPFDGPLEEIKP